MNVPAKNPITVAIEQTESRFLSIAPAQMKFEAEKGFAIQLLKNNDYLNQVAHNHPVSLQQALTNVAAIGLSLNPAEKQAYLITRTVSINVNGQKKYETRIFLEPSYMGLIKLATDSGSIKWVQALPVYDKDEFTYMGAGIRPKHTFNAFAKQEDRGNFIGVYCVAKTAEGDFLTTMMDEQTVNSIRERSESWKAFKAGKAKSGGPWQTDFIEQAKKTVIRNAFKTWPRTNLNRMAAAIELSNDNEGFEPILTAPSLGEYTAETKQYFDQLIQQQDALNMFVLQCSLNEKNDSAFTNLYHSFEKGTKGKYQSIVNDLLKQGFIIMEDIRAEFKNAADRGDEMGMRELIDGLSSDAITVMKNGMEFDYKNEVDQLGVI